MEKDDLKDLWKQSQEEMPQKVDLESVYSAKSTGLVDKIHSTIKMEQTMNYVLFPAIIVVFGVLGHYWMMVLSIILAVGSILYYQALISKLNKTGIEHSVLDYLKESYSAIITFKRHYLSIGLMMFLVGFFMGSSAVSDILEGDYENVTKLVMVLLAIVVLAIVVVGGIFYLLYGKNITKLKRSIEGLGGGE